VLTNPAWADVPGLRHGFLDGAESAGDWDGVLARLGFAPPLRLPRQVHGTRVVAADWDAVPEADAVWTAASGVLAGIVTADCVPVLLLAPRRRVVAAVHAGWRGAAAGVVEAALASLRGEGGAGDQDIQAALGPAVGGCCYEVGAEVRDAFRRRTGEIAAPAWTTRQGRAHVDLRHAVSLLLAAAGVSKVAVLGPCTACSTTYRSYRRDGSGAGRQLSFIGWS
jgi:YfiH family protein